MHAYLYTTTRLSPSTSQHRQKISPPVEEESLLDEPTNLFFSLIKLKLGKLLIHYTYKDACSLICTHI